MAYVRCLSFPVLVVLGIIFFIYHTTIFLVIEPWLGLDTAPGILNGTFFTALAVMILFCYVLAIGRDPGSIPNHYMPDTEDTTSAIREVKRKGGDFRYCQKCGNYKPPRTHHCRVCKRCVLKMDHHCVWINNCVGLRNYKAFFLFISYVTLALAHTLVLLASQFIYELDGDEEAVVMSRSFLTPFVSSPAGAALNKILCALISAPLLLALGVLLLWHVYLMLTNRTTIEYHEGVRAKWLAKKAGEDYKHPYDLGIVNNLIATLGDNIACWGCPLAVGHLTDGLKFETAFDLPQERSVGVGEGGMALNKSGGLWLTRRTRLPC